MSIWSQRRSGRNRRLAAAKSALRENLSRQERCDASLGLLEEGHARLLAVRGQADRYTRQAAGRLATICT